MNEDQPPVHDDATGDRSERPPFDLSSLVAGIVVLALAAAFAFGDLDTVRDQARIVWPIALLGVGVGFLFGAGGRR